MSLSFERLSNSIADALGVERVQQFSEAVQSVGADLMYVISKLNRLNLKGYIEGEFSPGFKPVEYIDTGYSGGRRTRSFTLEGIEAAIQQNKDEYNRLFDLLNSGSLTGDVDALKILLESYSSYVENLQDLQDQLRQYLTGITSDSIADSIIDGFKKGYTSAADFADNFQDLMENAILQALKIKAIEQPIQDWYADFAEYMKDGLLTEEEKEKAREAYNKIIDSASVQFDLLKEVSGMDLLGLNKQDNLKGVLAGVSEQTAGMISGQLYAIRQDMKYGHDVMVNQLAALEGIRENTNANPEYLPYLKDMYDKMSTSQDNTQRAIGL